MSAWKAIVVSLVVAFGCSGKPSPLEQLKSRDSDVRRSAVWKLGAAKDKSALSALVAVMERDESPEVRRAAAGSIGDIGGPVAIDALLQVSSGPAPIQMKVAAMNAVKDMAGCKGGKCDPLPAARKLVPGLIALWRLDGARHDNNYSQAMAESILSMLGDVSFGPLLEALKDPHANVRRSAAVTLRRAGDKRAVTALTPLLNDPDGWVRTEAARSIGDLGK